MHIRTGADESERTDVHCGQMRNASVTPNAKFLDCRVNLKLGTPKATNAIYVLIVYRL